VRVDVTADLWIRGAEVADYGYLVPLMTIGSAPNASGSNDSS